MFVSKLSPSVDRRSGHQYARAANCKQEDGSALHPIGVQLIFEEKQNSYAEQRLCCSAPRLRTALAIRVSPSSSSRCQTVRNNVRVANETRSSGWATLPPLHVCVPHAHRLERAERPKGASPARPHSSSDARNMCCCAAGASGGISHRFASAARAEAAAADGRTEPRAPHASAGCCVCTHAASRVRRCLLSATRVSRIQFYSDGREVYTLSKWSSVKTLLCLFV